MKNLILIAFVAASIFNCELAFSQGFQAPAPGNAAIYFVRVTNVGGSSSFEYFRNRTFIGIFKGKNYMRFEYPAGKQLFWVSSEDKEFLDCDLQAGEIYIVLVNVEMGLVKARIGLEPILPANPDFLRVLEVVNSKPPIVTPDDLLAITTAKLHERGFIEEMMNRYNTEWKYASNNKVISPDMFVPFELLK